MPDDTPRGGDVDRLERLRDAYKDAKILTSSDSGMRFLLGQIDARDAELREAHAEMGRLLEDIVSLASYVDCQAAEIEALKQVLADKEKEDAGKLFIDEALPEGWTWTIRKFHNHPWADCGYAEAKSPHDEPVYKAYGHTPAAAFREVVNQALTGHVPETKL